ncbi:MAG: 3-deoxy-manno-octulosonate cytidylyltransferase [Thermodesulfovibrionales bacterium]
MSAIVIIPARYTSTRFPGKPLALLKGMPVIEHVYQRAVHSRLADDVVVATDNKTIYDKVLSFGGKAVMTSSDHASGTDRVAEVAASMNYDIIVNVQGDEPLIEPEMIDDVISVLDDPRVSMGTLAIGIKDRKDIFDPNIVKVVFNRNGFAFYFSRAPIPYHRDEWKDLDHFTIHDSHLTVFKHIGIYSYRKDVLAELSKLPPSSLEVIEKLEQLRALEHGFIIKVKETTHDTLGVDTPEDLERIEKCLNSSL